MRFKVTKFAERHFSPDFSGTRISISVSDFEAEVDRLTSALESDRLVDSGMDFCRYLTLNNFVGCEPGAVSLKKYDPDHRMVRTGYFSRTPDELPVLSRWLEIPKSTLNPAEYIKLVLYSKEQLMLEADINQEPYEDWTDWNIVAIIADDSYDMSPMPPITMIRNALGITEGGNGVQINRADYAKSVAFWSDMINVKSI